MSLLAWPITVIALLFMAPWARWLLRRAEGTPVYPPNYGLLLTLSTLALSLGTLTLVMLACGLFGLLIDWRTVALVCLGISACGLVIPDRRVMLPDESAPTVLPRPLLTLSRVVSIVIIGIAALILFNAVYWPFGIDDAVTIYASFGKAIAASGHLPIGNLYETYPMLVPLGYAFTHQAAGWRDEHLAALIPALLSVGILGVAYLLGCELRNRATGLIAALLIALTPMVTHWASAGYVDLPCGFFYGFSALFLARYYRTRSWPDVLLCGIMAGLAAWTKNSGLLIVIPIGLFVLYCWWQARSTAVHFNAARLGAWLSALPLPLTPAPRKQTRPEVSPPIQKRLIWWGPKEPPNDPDVRPFRLRHVLLLAASALAIAAPWYAHTLAMAGVLVPPTGWTWLAQHSLANLIPYLIDGRYFVIGVLFTAGLALTLWRVGHTRGREMGPVLLILFYLPFFAIWWALFSYDGRFLLVLTPLIAVMTADALLMACAWLAARLAPLARSLSTRFATTFMASLATPFVTVALIIITALLALPAISAAVDYKFDLLRQPFMSDADKHSLRLGTDRYAMDLYLGTLPAGSRVWTEDLLLPYNAEGMVMTVGGPPNADMLRGYDYWVLSPDESLPAWFGGTYISADPLHSEGGYRVYDLTPR
jgi:Dolichyl-phosphate-mannose-protein mannosyltransferase